MPTIFISYRRQDSSQVAGRIHDRLIKAFNRKNVFKDVDDLDYGEEFPEVLKEALAASDIVLVIIGQQWLDIKINGGRRLDDPKDFVRIEIETALKKENCRVIPVLVDNVDMPEARDLPSILRRLASKHAIKVRNDPDFHRDVDRLIASLKGKKQKHNRLPVFRLIIGLLTIFSLILLFLFISASIEIPATQVATQTVEDRSTEPPSDEEIRATGDVQAYETLTAAAPTSISSSDMQKTRQAEIFATVTHEAQTQTVVFGQQTQVAEATEQFILAATRTFQLAQTGVERNADWTPEIHEFDGVEMVLVPRGCFMMGSDDGEDNEQPAHEQCFDEPFWIDRYEVTQGDFARLGGERSGDSRFVGDDRPVENITWYEARNFCESRDGYLPTEKEWEYAARGPDGLVYPWGNRWGDDLTVWGGNSGGLTAMVGSRFGSASWVGAQDMGGNVGEWTSSVYRNYPYDDRTNTDFDYYVVRGGGWSSSIYSLFRASLRVRYNPLTSYVTLGFRCARS